MRHDDESFEKAVKCFSVIQTGDEVDTQLGPDRGHEKKSTSARENSAGLVTRCYVDRPLVKGVRCWLYLEVLAMTTLECHAAASPHACPRASGHR
jgi:hypothetical protein